MKELFIISYFSLLFYVSFYGVHLYWMVYLYLRHRRREVAPKTGAIGRESFPMVTVQLPFYNEKRVAIRLIEAVLAFDWPRDRLEIQILDDSTDETSELIEDYLGIQAKRRLEKDELGPSFSYHHRTERTGFKAGALAEGLQMALGEFVAVFDADNLPDPDFLKANLPFFNDVRIGMVQARWGFLNRNESLLCRAQALFLDAHFTVEQQARCLGGLLFNFNGTAGVWRRKTIDQAGGWRCDTLTEDLDLSMRAQLAGWKLLYNHAHVVPTELPNRLSGFKSQQYRWSKGAVETAIKLLPTILRSSLPIRVKVASFFHLTSKSISPALLGLALLLVPALMFRLESGLTRLLLIDLPIFLAGTGSMSIFYGLAYRAHSPRKRFSDIAVLPWLTSIGIALAVNNSRAFFSAIFGRRTAFIRTPKSGSTDRRRRLIPSAYKGSRDHALTIEAFLALYSLTAMAVAVNLALWFTLPFLATFFVGFSYFSWLGLKESYAD